MTSIRITRAVSYGRDDNDNITISIIEPWDGFQRITAFPPHVQEIVQGIDERGRNYLMATVDETNKLWLARQISEEARAAVWSAEGAELEMSLVSSSCSEVQWVTGGSR